MFQIVCRHMIRYVNLQPTVILSLKIKSRAKKQTNKQTTTTEKRNTHSVLSRVQKSVSDLCGAEEKLRYLNIRIRKS